MNLADKKCAPCEKEGKALTREETLKFLHGLTGWEISPDAKTISRDLCMKNFMAAIRFMNQVARIAEDENHHPDFHLSGYRNLRIELSTHALNGLTENDFIVATKINKLPLELKDSRGGPHAKNQP